MKLVLWNPAAAISFVLRVINYSGGCRVWGGGWGPICVRGKWEWRFIYNLVPAKFLKGGKWLMIIYIVWEVILLRGKRVYVYRSIVIT